MDRLPPFSVLRAFVATVRYGGVTRAAEAIYLTPGAVSRAVKTLEEDLGQALFVRAGRTLVPTTTALQLADDLEVHGSKMAAALSRARNFRGGARPVILSCEPTFLIRWLIPRLGGMQAAVGEDREVRLVSAGGPVDFVRDGIDLAIRRADFRVDGTIRAEPFLVERVGPVVARTATTVLCTQTLLEGTLIHTATRPNGWAEWAQTSGVRLAAMREIHFEHFYQSLQAASAGAGAAIGPIALVSDDLAAGMISAPYGLVPDGSEYILMALRDGGDDALFERARDWLSQEVAQLARLALNSADLLR